MRAKESYWGILTAMSLALGLVPGCAFEDLDLGDRNCPCGPNFVCNEITAKCVPVTPIDVGRDPDAGRTDGLGTDIRVSDVASDEGARDIVSPDTVSTDSGPGDTPTDTADAPPTDVGVDVPPPLPFCERFAGSLRCEDFESGIASWVEYGETGGLLLDPAVALEGSFSLRAMVSRGGISAALTRPLPATISSGTFYFQVNFWVPDPPGEVSVVAINTRVAPFHGVTLSLRSRNVEGFVFEGSEAARTVNEVRPASWNCVDAQVDIGNGDGLYEFALNGGPVVSLNADTSPSRGYEQTNLGLTFNPAGAPAALVRLDNFVVHTAPTTCP